ncbi:MAG: S8/S53 family peptidase [Leptolyngbyaceae cyanobacterium bins.349]|nr:S8/S53 family peptidase [Leptolyngbyaceae cyanobacterium bins.349]
MKRDQYSNSHNHTSFQPQAVDQSSSLAQNQPGHTNAHSSSTTTQAGSHWFNQAGNWLNQQVQAAQNLMGGDSAIAAQDVLPALKSGNSSPPGAASKQPLVGIIDSGFGTNDHGRQMLDTIRDVNPDAAVVLKDGVGQGGWAESLTEFVDLAKAAGQPGAVANLSFDLTETRPDGTVTTRSQLTAEEHSALAYAQDNNVLVVASAGNEGGAMSALGQASQQFDNIIAVGAAEGDQRANYSSYGAGLDLVANGSKNGKEGTSFAAAEVTGAISELWETNPHLSARQVNQTLQATATDLNTAGWDAETGFGKLNVDLARSVAQQITPDTQSFSGAALLQQAQGSFDSTLWQSKDGAIAGERSNFLGMKLPKPPKPKDLGNAIANKGRDLGNAAKREVRETKTAATQKGRDLGRVVKREVRETKAAATQKGRDLGNAAKREVRETKAAATQKGRDLGNAVKREVRETKAAATQKGRDLGNAVKREVRETKAAATQKGRDLGNAVKREVRETKTAVAQKGRDLGRAVKREIDETALAVGNKLIKRNNGSPVEYGTPGHYPAVEQSNSWSIPIVRPKDDPKTVKATTASNGFEVGLASMRGVEVVNLEGQLLDQTRTDNAIVGEGQLQDQIIDAVRKDPRYGKEAFSVSVADLPPEEVPRSVQFGGKRSEGAFWMVGKETWEVAGNELTWVRRGASVEDSSVEVDPNGNMNIQYRTHDTLDLSPTAGRGPAYNAISTVLGVPYHTVAGANSNLQTRAEWSTEVKA